MRSSRAVFRVGAGRRSAKSGISGSSSLDSQPTRALKSPAKRTLPLLMYLSEVDLSRDFTNTVIPPEFLPFVLHFGLTLEKIPETG